MIPGRFLCKIFARRRKCINWIFLFSPSIWFLSSCVPLVKPVRFALNSLNWLKMLLNKKVTAQKREINGSNTIISIYFTPPTQMTLLKLSAHLILKFLFICSFDYMSFTYYRTFIFNSCCLSFLTLSPQILWTKHRFLYDHSISEFYSYSVPKDRKHL